MTMEALPQDLADFLVTKNFDPEYFDKQGQPSEAGEAVTIKFDYVADSGKNYGTAVCVISNDELSLYYGDNLGRGMEPEDKDEWYSFLEQLSNQAASHSATWTPTEINKLKHNLAGIAAIKEGLFEGYYGSRKVSYMGEQTQARLVINHNRVLGENDKRFRYVESLFIETADQERFRLSFKSLAGGRAMLEHVRSGGRPYDVRGNHIAEIVGEMAVLSRFNRAQHHRVYEGITQELVESAQQYYRNLQETIKHLGSPRGYQAYFESWAPDQVGEAEALVENLRDLFVEQTLDARIEAALPTLAKIQQQGNNMKEAQIFENWVNNLSAGTWALPETPEQQEKLNKLMSGKLIVGPDATNATEQLYDIVGDKELFEILEDLADQSEGRANIWEDSEVQRRLAELGVQTPESTRAEPADVDQVNEAQTYGRDNPYEVKPGENFSKVFEPGRKSGVHYHLMTGSVADPFYFKLNDKLYSVSQNGDGIPREVGVDDNDLGNDVPMPGLIDYGKSSTQDPNLQLAKDYAKLYGHYDPENMDDINSLLYVMRSNPRVKADFERAVEWARSKNKGVAESQLDEIGDRTLSNYVGKAVSDVADRSKAVGQHVGFQKGAQFATKAFTGSDVLWQAMASVPPGRSDSKIDQRKAGIDKAITRMNKGSGGAGGGFGGVKPGQSPSLDNPIQNENSVLATMLKHAGVPLREGVLNDDTRNTWDHLLDRFRHEVEKFKKSGKLDDDLYDAVFDYYDQHGAMPYRVRNAKDNTANQWVRGRLTDDLGIKENLISPMIMPVSEGSCNMTAEGSYCPEHGLMECGSMYEDGGAVGMPYSMGEDAFPTVNINGLGYDDANLAGEKFVNPIQPRKHNALSPLTPGDSSSMPPVAHVDLTRDTLSPLTPGDSRSHPPVAHVDLTSSPDKMEEGVYDPDYRGGYNNEFDELEDLLSRSGMSQDDLMRQRFLASKHGLNTPADMAKLPALKKDAETGYVARKAALDADLEKRNQQYMQDKLTDLEYQQDPVAFMKRRTQQLSPTAPTKPTAPTLPTDVAAEPGTDYSTGRAKLGSSPSVKLPNAGFSVDQFSSEPSAKVPAAEPGTDYSLPRAKLGSSPSAKFPNFRPEPAAEVPAPLDQTDTRNQKPSIFQQLAQLRNRTRGTMAETSNDDPINSNSAMTGAYYEGKETPTQEGDALLARIKSLALLR